MKSPATKALRKIFLMSLILGATVPLLSLAYAQENTLGNPPSVAQTLVPEGLLATELAKALKIGQPQNEAAAESMLSSIGIEPKNGWIADYPVTPDIIGEIERAVAAAADARRLQLGREQAQKAMEGVVSQLGLNVMAGSAQARPDAGTKNGTIYSYVDKDGVVHFTDRYENIPQEYRDQVRGSTQEPSPQTALESPDDATGPSANPNPEMVNSYYDEYGPPVVTYYAPPWPYYYMYAWVPYPFRCSGFFFSGFFILHDFHRHVFVHGRKFVVTNHVFNPRDKTFSAVDPAKRGFRGRAPLDRTPSPRVFSSTSAQAGARAIVETSRQRSSSRSTATGPGIRKETPSTFRTGAHERAGSGVPPVIAKQTNPAPSFAGGSSGAARAPREIIRQPISGQMRANRGENRERSRETDPRKSITPPPNRANGHQGTLGRQQAAGSRELTRPPASTGASNVHPSARVSSPPSAAPGRTTFGSALRGRSSSGESRMGMGEALGRFFPRGR